MGKVSITNSDSINIVVLDGYTLNPGDLSWKEFERFGKVTIYDRTPKEKILERADGAEIILTNKTPISEGMISKLPNLKYIGILATGFNNVDIEAASERGIIVTNVPNYGTQCVAQMTFALLLGLCSHVQLHSDAVREGEWSNSLDFCFTKVPLIELPGKTMGIIGMGSIGSQVAQIASALGMNVMAVARTKKNAPDMENFKWVEMDELLSTSDVVSLHC